jgi:cytochrome b subunit of formate dehydrogenase
VYIILTGMMMSILVLVVSAVLQFFIKIFFWIMASAYILTILFSLAAIVLGKFNKNDIRSRKSWLHEINNFDNLLLAYKFDIIDIERMIKYIDENIKGNREENRRKYDIFGKCISVTIVSFGIGIGVSIWNSYEFKGHEALITGAITLLSITIVIMILLFILFLVYDSLLAKQKIEEKIKIALQEILFRRRSVRMYIIIKRDSYKLLEDSTVKYHYIKYNKKRNDS